MHMTSNILTCVPVNTAPGAARGFSSLGALGCGDRYLDTAVKFGCWIGKVLAFAVYLLYQNNIFQPCFFALQHLHDLTIHQPMRVAFTNEYVSPTLYVNRS